MEDRAGAATGVYRFIDDDICIILLSNITPSPIGHMAKDIAAILFDQRYDMPQDLTRGIVLTDKELDDYCGRFQVPDYHKIPEKPGIVVLTKQDGMLLASLDDLPTVELIPVKNDVFFFKIDPTRRLLFKRDSNGSVISFINYDVRASDEEIASQKPVMKIIE